MGILANFDRAAITHSHAYRMCTSCTYNLKVKMATGRIHWQANKLGVVVAVAVSAYVGIQIGQPLLPLYVGLGALIACFITPDADLKFRTYPEEWLYKKNYYVGLLFEEFWQPYATAADHRVWWTHWPVVSTLIRVLYMAAIFYFSVAIAGNFSHIVFGTDPMGPTEWLFVNVFGHLGATGFYVGWAWGDFIHWVLDRKILRPYVGE